MPPTSQKPNVRPIAFVFHNQVDNEVPRLFPLSIRPDDLTRTDTSRLNVAQTMGGAWADSWGAGLPSAQISGTTGWGQGIMPDGMNQFKGLYDTVFTRWHKERAAQLAKGGDPDGIKLLFVDVLDDFTWVIAPQQFVLKRSRSRPLLYQYQISFIQASDDWASTLKALAESKAVKDDKALSSLAAALEKIKGFIDDLKSGWLGKVLDTIQNGVTALKGYIADFCQLTYDVLNIVKGTIAMGINLLGDIPGALMEMGGNLSRAAANILYTVRSVIDLPLIAQAKLARAASSFENAWCILTNVLSARRFLPNYDTLYGSANCSSTAGGSPISRYDTENPFPALTKLPDQTGQAPWWTGTGKNSLTQLAGEDTVLQPKSLNDTLRLMGDVNTGMGIR
jgi:hypothetical protein